jgi:hypothetical protein
MGVDHSTVANNTSKNNSGGILFSDDTGATHHNLIVANLVKDNVFDCGITLASHPPYTKLTSTTSSLGVFRNTVGNNDASHNGTYPPESGRESAFSIPYPAHRPMLTSAISLISS